MPGGLLLGLGSAVLYGVATVLQAAGARQVTGRRGSTPTTRDLMLNAAWVTGIAVLVLAFGLFVASAQLLPLPVVEVIRSAYLAITVVLGQRILGIRAGSRQYLGLVVIVLGLALVVAAGGVRGTGPGTPETWLVSVVVLAGALIAAGAAARLPPRSAAPVLAVIGGAAFAVLDLGVRAAPVPLSVSGALTTPALWLGAVGALTGLVLLGKAMASATLALANTLLLISDVTLASVLAMWLFGDRFASAPLAIAAGFLLIAGTALVVATDPAPTVPRTTSG